MAATTTKAKPVNVTAGTPWSTALLELLGAPATPQNYQFLNAWATREHGASYPKSLYANNPFFTTAGGSGSAGPYKAGAYPLIPGSAFPGGVNSAGVPAYPDITVGTLATADTLAQYPGIVDAIKSGHPEAYAGNSQFQQELKTWSGSGYSAVAVRGQPGVAEGPALTTPIEGVSAASGGSFDFGSVGSVTSGAASASKSAYNWYDTTLGYGQPSLKAAGDAIKAPIDVIKWLFDTKNLVRVGEILGGSMLIGLGLIMIGRAASNTGPAQQLTGAAQTAAKPVTVVRARRTRQRAVAVRAEASRAREARSAELATSKVKLNQARATELRTRTKHRRRSKAEQTEAERRAYIKGATDQARSGLRAA